MPSFYDQASVQWLQGLKGLNDAIPPGSRHEVFTGQPGIALYTPDLLNVKVRFGNVSARGGMTSYKGAVASSTSPIIGLFPYNRANGAANSLLRVTPTKLELLSGSVWTDVTGQALLGTSLTRPQFTIQNDILIYTMEGLSRPQGYGTNSGVAVAYSTGTQLGGTPPFAKSLVSYMQFLLLGNISADGTFTDVFDGWRLIEYSDSPFTDWTNCNGNTIDLYQTAGDLVAMAVLGRVCMCYKTDGVVRLTWVGGAVRFTQELIPGSTGCAAPLSVVDLGTFGHAYLGTNGLIYSVTQNQIQAVSFEALSRTLPPALRLNRFKYSRGFNLPTQDTYLLFYDRTGLSGQFLDSYVAWNYRTGEFVKGQLGQQVIGGCNFRSVNDTQEIALVSTNTKVEEFDSTLNTQTDDGVAFPNGRYWTTGWQKLADEEGFLYGVVVIMRKSNQSRIKVSLARNMSKNFEREQIFSLRGGDPTDDMVECDYRFPAPVLGSWFNVKVSMLNDSLTSTAPEMMRIGFITEPKHKVPGVPQQLPENSPTTGS